MTLVWIGCFTLSISVLICARRAVEARAIRWSLYRLRDELRFLAIDNRSLLGSPAFKRLDSSLTGYCANLSSISLWTMLPLLADRHLREMADKRQGELVSELAKPELAAVKEIYERASNELAKHFMLRHLFLTCAVVVTVIGAVAGYHCAEWLSQRMMSDAIRPPAAPGGLAHAT